MRAFLRFFRVLALNLKKLGHSPVPPAHPIGFLSQRQLTCASEVSRQTGKPISEVLMNMNADDRDRLTNRARQIGVPYVDLERVVIGSAERNLIPVRVLRDHHMVPLKKRGKTLYVATADPADKQSLDVIERESGLRVMPILVSADAIQRVLEDWA